MKMLRTVVSGLFLSNFNREFAALIYQLEQLIVYLIYLVTNILYLGQRAIPPLLGFSTIR
jgi:hypothetical protein